MGGAGMSQASAGRNALERRYARLLLLYPAGYRRSRGTELLATLLESTPDGRSRPALREVGPLVLGALRAHAGRRHNLRLTWLATVHAAVVMLLLTDVLRGAVDIAMAVGLLLLSAALQPFFFLFQADAMAAGVTTAGATTVGATTRRWRQPWWRRPRPRRCCRSPCC